jgi:hypothetical protein
MIPWPPSQNACHRGKLKNVDRVVEHGSLTLLTTIKGGQSS